MKAAYRSPKYPNNTKWLLVEKLTVTITKLYQEHAQLQYEMGVLSGVDIQSNKAYIYYNIYTIYHKH